MKLVAQLKLLASPAQAGLLRRTLATANPVANTISAYAHAHRTFRTCDLHRALYYTIKHDFGLSAQMVVRTLAKVGDSYKTGDQHLRRRNIERAAVNHPMVARAQPVAASHLH